MTYREIKGDLFSDLFFFITLEGSSVDFWGKPKADKRGLVRSALRGSTTFFA